MNAAVLVQIVDTTGIIYAMESFVIAGNAFSGTVSGLTLTAGAAYTLKAVDFDGGKWGTKEFTVPADPPVTPPSSGKTVETDTVQASVSGGKATVRSIDTDKAEEDAPVSIDLSESKTEITAIQLPAKAVKAITEASDEGVEIKLTEAEIKLDADTLKTLTEAMGGKSMSLTVKVGSDAVKELSAEQNKVIGAMKDTVVIRASITAGGKTVSDFGGGTVELTVDYKWNGKGVLRAAFVNDDGTVEIVPVVFRDGKATISVKHFSSYVIYTEDALAFADVTDPVEFYYDAVRWAVEAGVTTGTDPTHFTPGMECDRAQMVTFLWRAAGSPEPTTAVCPFTDVSEGAYYYKAVLWAVENGITNGTGESTFSPDRICTRAQAVTFLYRFEGSKAVVGENGFTDVICGSYYYDAVIWAVETGVTNGTSTAEMTFSPDKICTRGEIVTFLYRDMKQN